MRIETDRTLLEFAKGARNPEFYVAVSGGVDSIAAAFFLFKFYGSSMGICHFNHKLRPQNEEMQAAAKRLAKDLGVSFWGGYRFGELQKGSVENELRKARLEFFNGMRQTIVLAHHLDDAVESYFMNFLRGCPEHTPIPKETIIGDSKLIRPFLRTTKDSFQQFACKHGLLEYVVEDETNAHNEYRRNWTRNEVLPKLKPFGLRKVVRKKFYS